MEFTKEEIKAIVDECDRLVKDRNLKDIKKACIQMFDGHEVVEYVVMDNSLYKNNLGILEMIYYSDAIEKKLTPSAKNYSKYLLVYRDWVRKCGNEDYIAYIDACTEICLEAIKSKVKSVEGRENE